MSPRDHQSLPLVPQRSSKPGSHRSIIGLLVGLGLLAVSLLGTDPPGSSAATTTRPKVSTPRTKVTPAPPRRRSTTTTLSPTRLAAQNYLWIVLRPNCAGLAWDNAEAKQLEYFPTFRNQDGSLDSVGAFLWWKVNVKPKVLAYQDALLSFARDLVTLTWPAQVRPSIDSLVTFSTQEAAQIDLYLSAIDFEGVLRWYNEWIPDYWRIADSRTAVAAEVRVRLGLPSNLGSQPPAC